MRNLFKISLLIFCGLICPAEATTPYSTLNQVAVTTGALKSNGTGTVAQASCSDLSDGATGCSTATGTSGATLPLLNGNNTQSGTLALSNQFLLTGIITPTTISTGNTNNYNPTGLSGANVIREICSGNCLITGLAGGVDGRIIVFENIGFNVGSSITLSGDDTNSTAANRFRLQGGITHPAQTAFIDEGANVILRYDGGISRWVPISFGTLPYWGQIKGTLSNQTDLQAALNALAPGGAANDIQYNNNAGGFGANADFYWDTTGGTNQVYINGFGGAGQSSFKFSNSGGTIGAGHDSANNGSNDFYIYNYTTSFYPVVIDNLNNWNINQTQGWFDKSGLFGIGTTQPAASADIYGQTFTAADPTIASLAFDFTGAGYTPDADGTTITRTLYEYSTHGGIVVFDAAPPSTTLLEFFNATAFSMAEELNVGNYTCNGQAWTYYLYPIYNGKNSTLGSGGTLFSEPTNDGTTAFQVNLAWTGPETSGGPPADSYILWNSNLNIWISLPAGSTTATDSGDGSWTSGTPDAAMGTFPLNFNLTMLLTPFAAGENFKLTGINPNALAAGYTDSITATGSTQSFTDDSTGFVVDLTNFLPASPYNAPSINAHGDVNIIGGNLTVDGSLFADANHQIYYLYNGVTFIDNAGTMHAPNGLTLFDNSGGSYHPGFFYDESGGSGPTGYVLTGFGGASIWQPNISASARAPISKAVDSAIIMNTFGGL